MRTRDWIACIELAALQHSRPRVAHCAGRQLFFRDAVARARDSSPNGVVDKASLKTIMACHAAEYASLPQSTRAGYEAQACSFAGKKLEGLQDDIGQLHTRIALEEMRVQFELVEASPWTLSSCRLSDAQKHRFRALFFSSEFSRSRVDELRKAATTTPPIPEMTYRLRLSNVQLALPRSSPFPA
jgi:hypothetical protein